MNTTLSKIIFVFSCIIAVLTFAATAWYIAMMIAISDYTSASDNQWAGWGLIACTICMVSSEISSVFIGD